MYKARMVFLDKHGFPVERVDGHWFQNLIRLLIHTRSIGRETFDTNPPVAFVTRAEDGELLESAWILIANAGGGDWTTQTAEWREAAARWRDKWMANIGATTGHITIGHIHIA